MKRTRPARTDQLTAHLPPHEVRSGTFIEYRPFRGWWLDNHDYPRYFGDEGDCLGTNWREAERALRWLYKE